ncbi:MAG: 5-dehydro-2-deoxygluconokinase [Armatimonadota bacterium]|nr:5-dehydro-2-deoxygluconokinase [Armatimonadota bacterium]MDW8155043.1 5-dehydro-2-deoxygluconokinase [Armatimonadota bacterium]
MDDRRYDVLAMGRCGIDLYSNDVGAPFVEIRSFAAYVGGCPTNVSVGTRRLGLRSALLTAVGDDPVGEFVLHFLRREGVDIQFVPRKRGRRTGAVVLGIEPPDRFPLVFYRDNAADLGLDLEDVCRAPVEASRVLFLTGTGLTAEPSRTATLFAAERAVAAGTRVVVDLDYRASLWPDARAYGVNVRALVRWAEVVVGNEEELHAATGREGVQGAAGALLELGPKVVVAKLGAGGSAVFTREGQRVDVPPFPVEVYKVLGAGDAFASGLLYGWLRGWDWYRAARLGNACGAIVVTRHGCANFMPYEEEALRFVEERGGF